MAKNQFPLQSEPGWLHGLRVFFCWPIHSCVRWSEEPDLSALQLVDLDGGGGEPAVGSCLLLRNPHLLRGSCSSHLLPSVSSSSPAAVPCRGEQQGGRSASMAAISPLPVILLLVIVAALLLPASNAIYCDEDDCYDLLG